MIDGEPGKISGSARKWSAFGLQATEASAQITSLDTALFVGTEGDLYRSGLTEKLPPHLDATGQAYSKVGTALSTFSAALTHGQATMSPLSAQAPGLWQAVQTAQTAVSTAQSADTAHAKAQSDAKNALKPGQVMPPDTYSSHASSAASSLTAAQKAWDDCHTAALKAKADVNTAADTCHDAIHDASGMRFHKNPSGWGKFTAGFKSFVKDHVAGLAKLSGVLKTISAVAGLLSFIPVVGEIAAPIALVTGAAALAIDGSIKYATGQGSWKTIIIDGALMALPGVGKFAGGLIRGTRVAQGVRGAGAFAKSFGKEAAGFRVEARVLASTGHDGVLAADRGFGTMHMAANKSMSSVYRSAVGSAKQAIKDERYTRPTRFRRGVRNEVWNNATKDGSGVVRDPLTDEVMKKYKAWDMGHKPGYEFAKHQASAQLRGITRKEFLNEHNIVDHYRPELPSTNRGHRLESPGPIYWGP